MLYILKTINVRLINSHTLFSLCEIYYDLNICKIHTCLSYTQTNAVYIFVRVWKNNFIKVFEIQNNVKTVFQIQTEIQIKKVFQLLKLFLIQKILSSYMKYYFVKSILNTCT